MQLIITGTPLTLVGCVLECNLLKFAGTPLTFAGQSWGGPTKVSGGTANFKFNRRTGGHATGMSKGYGIVGVRFENRLRSEIMFAHRLVTRISQTQISRCHHNLRGRRFCSVHTPQLSKKRKGGYMNLQNQRSPPKNSSPCDKKTEINKINKIPLIRRNLQPSRHAPSNPLPSRRSYLNHPQQYMP